MKKFPLIKLKLKPKENEILTTDEIKKIMKMVKEKRYEQRHLEYLYYCINECENDTNEDILTGSESN